MNTKELINALLEASSKDVKYQNLLVLAAAKLIELDPEAVDESNEWLKGTQ